MAATAPIIAFLYIIAAATRLGSHPKVVHVQEDRQKIARAIVPGKYCTRINNSLSASGI